MSKFKSSLYIATLFLAIFSFGVVQAEQSQAAQANSKFNPNEAERLLNKLTQSEPVQQQDLNKISSDNQKIQSLITESKNCIQETNSEIALIDVQIKAIAGEGPNQSDKTYSKYLSTEKQSLIERQAQCRLLLIHANKAFQINKEKIAIIQNRALYTQGPTILTRMNNILKEIQALSLPPLSAAVYQEITTLLAISIMSLLVFFGLLYNTRIWFQKTLARHQINFSSLILTFATLALLTVNLLNLEPFQNTLANQHFQKLTAILTLFLIGQVILKIVIQNPTVIRGLKWYGFYPRFLITVSQVVLIIWATHSAGKQILLILQAGSNLQSVFNSLFMIISLSVSLYLSYRFYFTYRQLFPNKTKALALYHFLWLITVSLIVLDVIGFYVLSHSITKFVLSFLIFAPLGLILLKGFSRAYGYLNFSPLGKTKLKYYFGYQSESPHFELVILKTIIQLSIISLIILFFSTATGGNRYYLDQFLNFIVNGFVVAGYQIKPFNILFGTLVFCLLMLASRYCARRYSNTRNQAEDQEEEEVQVALASIILYAGFTVSLIVGLLFSGFSFTSLAIIAGALSVGIGLGLQSIVNNFVSGLILLVEKPIKAGDRIAVNNLEGFVKRVRIRSTQIQTPSKEDIIIPNSDLVTKEVTNFMFANTNWRIKCRVGVAYGSDIKQVKKVLLDVAMSQKEIITKKPNAPCIYFVEFGDSALLFELWCTIADVNKKYQILSDLNCAVDDAFRENEINIAYPQLDLHLKELPVQKVK